MGPPALPCNCCVRHASLWPTACTGATCGACTSPSLSRCCSRSATALPPRPRRGRLTSTRSTPRWRERRSSSPAALRSGARLSSRRVGRVRRCRVQAACCLRRESQERRMRRRMGRPPTPPHAPLSCVRACWPSGHPQDAIRQLQQQRAHLTAEEEQAKASPEQQRDALMAKVRAWGERRLYVCTADSPSCRRTHSRALASFAWEPHGSSAVACPANVARPQAKLDNGEADRLAAEAKTLQEEVRTLEARTTGGGGGNGGAAAPGGLADERSRRWGAGGAAGLVGAPAGRATASRQVARRPPAARCAKLLPMHALSRPSLRMHRMCMDTLAPHAHAHHMQRQV